VTMRNRIYDAALRQIFLDTRTHNKWQPKDVPDNLLREVVDTMKMGPTSANCSPVRILFLKSKAKERLKPHLEEANKEKAMQAPAGLRYHRLRSQVLRVTAETFSPRRREELVRR
jgi:3-hydroxypropanoate dehydrogenase